MSEGRSVLVVDDDSSIRDLIEMTLADHGYDVQPAANGELALEIVHGRPPNLILLDMRMPVMDGWEFAREYRALPGPHVPIIVLTAARDARARAAEIEADGYLGKPFNLDELLVLVAHHASAEDPAQ